MGNVMERLGLFQCRQVMNCLTFTAVPASGMTAEKQDYQCELCILCCNQLLCWQC